MTSSYESIAAWYDNRVRTDPLYTQMVVPSLLKLAGNVEGLAICDLACGQGLVSRELARSGAKVTGVDLSATLLEMARQSELIEPLGVEYFEDDAQHLATLPGGVFDGVTCGMALMNIQDLGACARSVRRVLKPNGWFVATITHPCFQMPGARWVERVNRRVVREVAGYFEEGYWESGNPDSVRAQIGEHHRTLSTYVNTFADAGMVLERLDEPEATDDRAASVPGNLEIPSILSTRFAALSGT
jgi:2-polyprenyl-3-methyl-5-hydroxy-6-metoxy-1,4-benzoquinol methylase